MMAFLSHLLFHTEFLYDLGAQVLFFWVWYSMGRADGERHGRSEADRWIEAQARRGRWN